MLQQTPAQKKEFDDFIDMVLAYAKKHDFAYILSVGKYFPDTDTTGIMDSFHEHESCALHALTKMLLKPGPIASNLVCSMLEAAIEKHQDDTATRQ